MIGTGRCHPCNPSKGKDGFVLESRAAVSPLTEEPALAWACRRPVGLDCPGPPKTLLHDIEVAPATDAPPVVGIAGLLTAPDNVGWTHVNECGRCQQLVVACYRNGCGPISIIVSHLTAHVALIAKSKVEKAIPGLPHEVLRDLEDVLVTKLIKAFSTWRSWAPERLNPESPALFTTFASQFFIKKGFEALEELLAARNELTSSTRPWEDAPEEIFEGSPDQDDEIARLMRSDLPAEDDHDAVAELRLKLGDLLVQINEWILDADLTPVAGVPVAEIVGAYVWRGFVKGEVPVKIPSLVAELGMSRASIYRAVEKVRVLLEERRDAGATIPGLDAVINLLAHNFRVEET